jgi:hypothetical protein
MHLSEKKNIYRFCTERAKNEVKLLESLFSALFFHILGNSKKYYTFSTDIDKESFVSKTQMPGRKGLPRVSNTGQNGCVCNVDRDLEVEGMEGLAGRLEPGEPTAR